MGTQGTNHFGIAYRGAAAVAEARTLPVGQGLPRPQDNARDCWLCGLLAGGCRTGRTRRPASVSFIPLSAYVCCRLRGEGARCPYSAPIAAARGLQAVPIAASPRASSQGARRRTRPSGSHLRRVPEDERRSTRASSDRVMDPPRRDGRWLHAHSRGICALLNRLARSCRPGRGATISLGRLNGTWLSLYGMKQSSAVGSANHHGPQHRKSGPSSKMAIVAARDRPIIQVGGCARLPLARWAVPVILRAALRGSQSDPPGTGSGRPESSSKESIGMVWGTLNDLRGGGKQRPPGLVWCTN